MTVRWGSRAARSGPAVKPGRGGWSMTFVIGIRPFVSYTDPFTGNGASKDGWRFWRSRRAVEASMARLDRKRFAAWNGGAW